MIAYVDNVLHAHFEDYAESIDRYCRSRKPSRAESNGRAENRRAGRPRASPQATRYGSPAGSCAGSGQAGTKQALPPKAEARPAIIGKSRFTMPHRSQATPTAATGSENVKEAEKAGYICRSKCA